VLRGGQRKNLELRARTASPQNTWRLLQRGQKPSKQKPPNLGGIVGGKKVTRVDGAREKECLGKNFVKSQPNRKKTSNEKPIILVTKRNNQKAGLKERSPKIVYIEISYRSGVKVADGGQL